MKLSRFKQQFPLKISVRKIADTPWLLYFLLHDDEIVYIGKSSEQGLTGRLISHKTDKVFDAFFVIDNIDSEQDALKIESGFICLLRPKYNIASVDIDVAAINSLMLFLSKQTDLNNIVKNEVKTEVRNWSKRVAQTDLSIKKDKIRRLIKTYKKRAIDGTLSEKGRQTLKKWQAELAVLKAKK